MSEKPSLVVDSRVRDTIKGVKGADDFRVDGEFTDALSGKVETLLKGAVERAKANGRKTVRPEDL